VVEAAYDAVASAYVDAFGDDLDALPLDRAVLDHALLLVAPLIRGGRGRALDLGCGPGDVGRYLLDRGLRVVGLDLSMAMLVAARSRAGLASVRANMRVLPFGEESFSLAVAFYSLQHVARAQVGIALREVRRVLVPGGVLVVAAHLGAGDVCTTEFLGHLVAPVGGALYGRDEIEREVTGAGFSIDDERQRGPLGHEYPSQRIYLVAVGGAA
jgi:ubiquinone/menaquinone biosynthesis C-methylase UbiE